MPIHNLNYLIGWSLMPTFFIYRKIEIGSIFYFIDWRFYNHNNGDKMVTKKETNTMMFKITLSSRHANRIRQAYIAKCQECSNYATRTNKNSQKRTCCTEVHFKEAN